MMITGERLGEPEIDAFARFRSEGEPWLRSIAAVLLNWNGYEDTRIAVRSLLDHAYADLSIVVVDNGSRGDDAERIRDEFPTVHVIALRNNQGFSRAVNIGGYYALKRGAKHVMLFNNDAHVKAGDGLIEHLVEALESDSEIGAVGPLVVNDTAPPTLQAAGYQLSLFFPLPRPVYDRVPAHHRLEPRRVDYLTGACLLIRGSVFGRLGGLDPDFFLYCDDSDLALRMRKLGYRQELVWDGRVYHKKSVATTKFSEKYTYTMVRSLLILAQKHCRWYHWISALPTIVAISLGLAFANKTVGLRGASRAALRAWRDFLLHRWGGYDGSWPDPPPSLNFAAIRHRS